MNINLLLRAIALASDLQDPLSLIPRLIEEWHKGPQIVWGVRTKREGESFFTKLFSKMYYSIINRLTSIKMPALGTDVFLIDRVVIEVFKQMPEKYTSLYMSLAWLGFHQRLVFTHDRHPNYGRHPNDHDRTSGGISLEIF